MPTPNESYQYDPLYRLQEVDDATGAPWQSYTYNRTGDRLSKTTAGQTPVDSYSYTPDTHQLIGISGFDASSRAVDANGNTTAFQANGWMYGLGYNNANRLSLVQQNGTTIVAYRLDGKGERVRKLPAGGTPIEYVYDEAGRMLYEYTGPSQNRAYIWADDTLVATEEDNSTIHYVYTDHLGTPRALTTTTGTSIWAWPWLQNPFGEKAASGAGGYTFNLRYPGQYFDAETGLNYNLRRDYEAGTGRYIESDPIGLNGGRNTYRYANAAPFEYLDQTGLCTTLFCLYSTNSERLVGEGPVSGSGWQLVNTHVVPELPATEGFIGDLLRMPEILKGTQLVKCQFNRIKRYTEIWQPISNTSCLEVCTDCSGSRYNWVNHEEYSGASYERERVEVETVLRNTETEGVPALACKELIGSLN